MPSRRSSFFAHKNGLLRRHFPHLTKFSSQGTWNVGRKPSRVTCNGCNPYDIEPLLWYSPQIGWEQIYHDAIHDTDTTPSEGFKDTGQNQILCGSLNVVESHGYPTRYHKPRHWNDKINITIKMKLPQGLKLFKAEKVEQLSSRTTYSLFTLWVLGG